MTSLLAGMMVEQGALRWDSTVASVFPELAGTMDAGLRDVTLQQLLSHTSGIPSDNDAFGKLLTDSFAKDGLNLDELRYWLVKSFGAQPLATKPGTTFAYSNMGYTMAGAMIERVAKATWEELIVTRIFTPLGLRTAGFGPQATMGRVDAPLGHIVRQDGTLKPMLAGPDGDNPLIIGPAGTVHLSILDFATWAGWNAGEGRRGARARASRDRAEAAHEDHRRSPSPARRPAHPPPAPIAWVGDRPVVFARAVTDALRVKHLEPRHDHAAARPGIRHGAGDECWRKQRRPGVTGGGGGAVRTV